MVIDRKFVSRVCIGLIVAVLLGIEIYLSGLFLTFSLPFHDKELMLSESVCAKLAGHCLKVQDKSGEVLWQSDDHLRVQDILYYDADRDGSEELLLLCWKIGRYGSDRPFWVTRDEMTWSQHIFIYDFDPETSTISQRWLASDIGPVVEAWTSRQIGDTTALVLRQKDEKVTLWSWQGWGLKILDSSVSFLAVGDNLIHESIYRKALQEEDGFDQLYQEFAPRLKEVDIAVVNQETPFVDEPILYGSFPDFGTPLEDARALVDAGFNVFTCATNHAYDRGIYGIECTQNYLESHGAMCLGIHAEKEYDPSRLTEPLQAFLAERCEIEKSLPYRIINRNGIRVALMNYTYDLNPTLAEIVPGSVQILPEDDETLIAQIKEAQEASDAVVLFMHWGTEYNTKLDAQQKHLANLFTEVGVDVVVGTHPHVVQTHEMRVRADGHKTLIYYSLGNFVSGQTKDNCRVRGIATFTIGQDFDGVTVTDYGYEEEEIILN